jgi:hypothetical protein
MVYRVFVEKKPGLAHEAASLKAEINMLCASRRWRNCASCAAMMWRISTGSSLTTV